MSEATVVCAVASAFGLLFSVVMATGGDRSWMAAAVFAWVAICLLGVALFFALFNVSLKRGRGGVEDG